MSERTPNQTEAEFLASYDLGKYPAMALTVDLNIFTIRENQLQILLIKRGGHPFRGCWALPGGFVNTDEHVDVAAARELQEETNVVLADVHLEQLKTYAYPGRDPRGFIADVAYVALVPNMADPVAGDDADEARFFPVAEVLEEGFPLAFDHNVIIPDALERIRGKLEYTPLALKFLAEEEFTISELRNVYEVVWGRPLNPSNFRRKVQALEGFLTATGNRGPAAFDGGRTSDLYRADALVPFFPPIRRELS